MKLWIGYFESANYAGSGAHCVIESKTKDEAQSIISACAEDYYYEEDSHRWYAENKGHENEKGWAVVIRVVEFDESHELWKSYKNPEQCYFYPEVN